jgi:hypothetical protein
MIGGGGCYNGAYTGDMMAAYGGGSNRVYDREAGRRHDWNLCLGAMMGSYSMMGGYDVRL